MSKVFNMVGGGGGPAASIFVTGLSETDTVTATKGSKTLTGKWYSDRSGFLIYPIKDIGTWTVTATDGTKTATQDVLVDTITDYTISMSFVHIYGVTWDGSSVTTWVRTDDSEDFENPVPSVANGSGSSPFDDIYPWSGMVRVTDDVAGELVAIPKFWFKWTKIGSSLKLQIADYPSDGFMVSPAHMDRGDGAGERDVVYVGRYHCASGYKSTTGSRPLVNITRSTARSGIHALGDIYWQSDFSMRMTIWMLYMVEFADWNSQAKIGYGCGDGSSNGNMGYTDNMPYHTGTTQSSRDTYGLGTQYRNIEGLWDNALDWCDGCYHNGNGLNIIINPSNFSDSSGGTTVGVPSNGFPSSFTVSTVDGLKWVIYPTEASGSGSNYSSDNWYFDASRQCLRFGGEYRNKMNYGFLCVDCAGTTSSNDYTSCRIMKLP